MRRYEMNDDQDYQEDHRADADLRDDEVDLLWGRCELLGQFLRQSAVIEGHVERCPCSGDPGNNGKNLPSEAAIHGHHPGDDDHSHQRSIKVGDTCDHRLTHLNWDPIETTSRYPGRPAAYATGLPCNTATCEFPQAPSHSPRASASPLMWARRNRSSRSAASSRSPAAGRIARLNPSLRASLRRDAV